MEPSFGGYHSTADYSRDSNYYTPNRAYPSSPATSSFNQSAKLRQRPQYVGGPGAIKPVTTAPVPSQKLLSWFYDIVNKRQLNVLKVNYIFTLIAFFGLALISRLVIWAPLDSIAGIFGLLFSPQFWVSLVIVAGLFASGVNYFTTNYVFCASNESYPTADRPELPAAFLIFLLASSFMLCSISFLTGIVTSWMQSSTAFIFAFLSISVAAAKVSAENDFRLYFTGALPSTSIKTLLRFAQRQVQADAFDYLVRTAVTLRYSCGATFILCILSSTLRSYIFVLFDPILIAQIGAIVCSVFVLSDLLCIITNLVTMEKVEFVLPTPYFFSDARPDVVNLVNALNSDDILMRLFAFHDFYAKAKSENRAVFFTLSQPGNHPRLWDSVFFSCQKAIQYVSDVYMKETENVLIKNSAGLRHAPLLNNDRSTVKSTLLVPPTLKPKQHLQSRKPLFDLSPLTSKIRPFGDRLKNYFIALKPFVASVDTDIAAFAVEGLGFLVESSYTQDKFGIVQKRLPQIVETLLDLGVACDQLIRAKAMRQQTTVYAEQRVFMIRASAVAALTDIYTAFQNHIYDLSLTPNQLTQLNEYANAKHL